MNYRQEFRQADRFRLKGKKYVKRPRLADLSETPGITPILDLGEILPCSRPSRERSLLLA